MVTNNQPIPIPNSAFKTNCTLERWISLSANITKAAVRLTIRASCISLVINHVIVNSSVGTAASIIPRRPPKALASDCLTTASTVSTADVLLRHRTAIRTED